MSVFIIKFRKGEIRLYKENAHKKKTKITRSNYFNLIPELEYELFARDFASTGNVRCVLHDEVSQSCAFPDFLASALLFAFLLNSFALNNVNFIFNVSFSIILKIKHRRKNLFQ